MRLGASIALSMAFATWLGGCAAQRPQPVAHVFYTAPSPPEKRAPSRAAKPAPPTEAASCVPAPTSACAAAPAAIGPAEEEDLFRRFDRTRNAVADDGAAR